MEATTLPHPTTITQPPATAPTVLVAAYPQCPALVVPVPAHCHLCVGRVMAIPTPPQLSRPSTLPGIRSLQTLPMDQLPGRYDTKVQPPIAVSTPVHMHPDPVSLAPTTTQNTVVAKFGLVGSHSHSPSPDRDTRRAPVSQRRSRYGHEDESEKNLRRISYLQATKEA